MKLWSLKIAFRFLIPSRKGNIYTGFLLSTVGLIAGILTLITVLSVMNGLQQSFIRSINEVSSYHIRVVGEDIEALNRRLLSYREVDNAFPVIEFQSLIQAPKEANRGVMIKGVDPLLYSKDRGHSEQLSFVSGSFDLSEKRTILLGNSLAWQLGAKVGSTVSLAAISGDTFEVEYKSFEVTGIFKTGYEELNNFLAFISLQDAHPFSLSNDEFIGVKLLNPYSDIFFIEKLKQDPLFQEAEILSWREYNRSFFSALRMEKLIMLTLIGLIFIIVAVHIYYSMQRSVKERSEEIALFKAVGASSWKVRSIFLYEGTLISLFSSLFGCIGGIFVSKNINIFFNWIDKIVNTAISLLVRVSSLIGGEIYSSSAYRRYRIDYMPAEIMNQDIAIILLLATVSVFFAVYRASSGILKLRPAAILYSD